VGLIVIGTITAGYEDLGDQYMGYLYTIGNNVLTAAYLVVSKRFSDRTATRGFGLVFYTSITALPLSFGLAIARGEFASYFEFEHAFNPMFIGSLLTASALGVGMTYVVFLSATMNVSTVLGAYIFGDFTATTAKVTGIAISFGGGALFATAKLLEGRKKEASQKEIDLARQKVDMKRGLGVGQSPRGSPVGKRRQSGSGAQADLIDPNVSSEVEEGKSPLGVTQKHQMGLGKQNSARPQNVDGIVDLSFSPSGPSYGSNQVGKGEMKQRTGR